MSNKINIPIAKNRILLMDISVKNHIMMGLNTVTSTLPIMRIIAHQNNLKLSHNIDFHKARIIMEKSLFMN
jgi:hypothetical protein